MWTVCVRVWHVDGLCPCVACGRFVSVCGMWTLVSALCGQVRQDAPTAAKQQRDMRSRACVTFECVLLIIKAAAASTAALAGG